VQHDLKADAEVVAIQPEANKLTEFARTVAIKTNEQYQAAANYLKSIKGLLGKIEDARTRVTKPLLAAQREVNAQAKDAAEPLQKAERLIKVAMDGFIQEQNRLRLEEQRKADEAARKQQEKLQQQAAKAMASGKMEKAAELEQLATAVVAPAIHRDPPKVAGIVTKEVWKFEIIDPNQVPRNFCSPDEQKIGGVVRALKGDTQIPGVRVWKENQIAAGAA
jgi:hypothetical protein